MNSEFGNELRHNNLPIIRILLGRKFNVMYHEKKYSELDLFAHIPESAGNVIMICWSDYADFFRRIKWH